MEDKLFVVVQGDEVQFVTRSNANIEYKIKNYLESLHGLKVRLTKCDRSMYHDLIEGYNEWCVDFSDGTCDRIHIELAPIV